MKVSVSIDESGNSNSKQQSNYNPWKDYSTYSLLIVNLISIVWAVVESWDLVTLMWVYWIQSITLGATNLLRILNLKKFTADNITFNGQKLPSNQESKIKLAVFFAFHYGGMHLVYFLFLLMFAMTSVVEIGWAFIAYTSLLFIFNHLFSFFYHKPAESNRVVKMSTLMKYPYARILPMHIIIILGMSLFGGQSSVPAVVLFAVLKTVADLMMHIMEHNFYAKQPNA